jgi:hypothetical protein
MDRRSATTRGRGFELDPIGHAPYGHCSRGAAILPTVPALVLLGERAWDLDNEHFERQRPRF